MTKVLRLSAEDVRMLERAFATALDEIEDWEFGLRMVLGPNAARAIVRRLADHVEPDGAVVLELTSTELAMVSQALNEALHGLYRPDDEALGPASAAMGLHDRIRHLY